MGGRGRGRGTDLVVVGEACVEEAAAHPRIGKGGIKGEKHARVREIYVHHIIPDKTFISSLFYSAPYNFIERGSNFDVRPEGMDEATANQLAAQAFLQQVRATDMDILLLFNCLIKRCIYE